MSADPFAALEACVAGYSKIIEDLGGCDHSVGICMCDEILHTRKAAHAIDQLRARVAELEKEAMILRGTVEAVTTQRQQAEQRNAELKNQNELLIQDRSRFPDKSCEVGNIIAAHVENLKATADSNAEAWRWVCVRESALRQRVAELVAALREVDEIVNDANHSAEDRLCAAANRLLNTRAESATPDHIPDAAKMVSATPANPSQELWDKLGDDMRHE